MSTPLHAEVIGTLTQDGVTYFLLQIKQLTNLLDGSGRHRVWTVVTPLNYLTLADDRVTAAKVPRVCGAA